MSDSNSCSPPVDMLGGRSDPPGERASVMIEDALTKLAPRVLQHPDVHDKMSWNPLVQVMVRHSTKKIAAVFVFTATLNGTPKHMATITAPMFGADEFPQSWPYEVRTMQDAADVIFTLRAMIADLTPFIFHVRAI